MLLKDVPDHHKLVFYYQFDSTPFQHDPNSDLIHKFSKLYQTES